MADKNSGGVGICGVLFIVFLVLKLCKVITWSWVWVLSPIWIPLGISIVLLIIILIIQAVNNG